MSKPLFNTAQVLIAQNGWSSFSLPSLALAQPCPLFELEQSFRDHIEVVTEIWQDATMSALQTFSPTSKTRANIVEIFLNRFDLLVDHQTAWRNIMGSMALDPLLSMRLWASCAHTEALVLAKSGGITHGMEGYLKIQALTGLAFKACTIWANDTLPEAPKTMHFLDASLDRFDGYHQRFHTMVSAD